MLDRSGGLANAPPLQGVQRSRSHSGNRGRLPTVYIAWLSLDRVYSGGLQRSYCASRWRNQSAARTRSDPIIAAVTSRSEIVT